MRKSHYQALQPLALLHRSKPIIEKAKLSLFNGSSFNVPCLWEWSKLHVAPIFHASFSSLAAPALTGTESHFNSTNGPNNKPYIKVMTVRKEHHFVSLEYWVFINVLGRWRDAKRCVKRRHIWVEEDPQSSDETHHTEIVCDTMDECKQLVKEGDVIYLSKELKLCCLRAPLDKVVLLRQCIVYQDEDYIGINKPNGIFTHQSKESHLSIQHHLGQLKHDAMSSPPYVLTYLTSYMSGVVLLCRSKKMLLMAKDQEKLGFRPTRVYWGVVCGKPTKEGGVLRIAMGYSKAAKCVVPLLPKDGGEVHAIHWEVKRRSNTRDDLTLLQFETNSEMSDHLYAQILFGLHCTVFGTKGITTSEEEWVKNYKAICSELGIRIKVHPHSELHEPHLHLRSMELPSYTDRLVMVAPLPHHMKATFQRLGWSL